MPSPREILQKALRLRAGEAAPLLALAALSFGRGAAAVLFDTAANTRFVKAFGSGTLPFVYLGAAAVSLALGGVYAGLAARTTARRMLLGTVATVLAGTAAIYAGFALRPAPWLVLVAMVWKEALFISLNIVLWAAAGYLFDLRQGKRLFGLVAAGGIVANIAGGLTVSWLVARAGLDQLFLLSALALAATGGILAAVMKRFPAAFQVEREPAPRHAREGTARPWWHLFRNRYLGLFLSLSLLSNFGFFFSDYVYFNRVGSAIHGEAALASFFGHFSAALGAVQLVTSLCLAGPIITRFGLGCALMALPAINGLGMAAAAGVSFFLGLNSAFFWLVLFIKLCDEALRASLLGPAFRILYQPLPARERLSFQAKTESILEPLGVGLAGGVLLLLTVVWPVALPQLCLILVLILAVWIGVAELLRHEYTRMLTQALSHRRLSGAGALFLEDSASATILLKGARGANAGEAIHCLRLLEESGPAEWATEMAGALTHPDAEVRAYAADRIEARGLAAHGETLFSQARTDSSAKVRRTALRAYCALRGGAAVGEIAIPSSWDLSRQGALAGWLRGDEAGAAYARERLREMTASAREEDRRSAAEILGDAERELPPDLLAPLLGDSSLDVRRAAIRAAARSRHPALIPLLLENLRHRALRPAALAALTSYGEQAVPAIAAALRTEDARDVRRSLVRAAGQSGAPGAAPLLVSLFPQADKALRRRILTALEQLRHRVRPADHEAWTGLIRRAAAGAAWTIHTRAALTATGCWPRLDEALAAEAREDQEQLLALLSFLPEAQALRHLRGKIFGASAAHRARAVELMENLVPAPLKPEVLPLLDDLPLERRAALLARVHPAGGETPEGRLARIARDDEDRFLRWTRACALYEAGRDRAAAGEAAAAAIRGGADDDDPFIRETALWAAAQELC